MDSTESKDATFEGRHVIVRGAPPIRASASDPGGSWRIIARRTIARDDLPLLPVPLTTFIGREGIVTAISDILLLPETRLLTLTGPGGVGKTRLALKVAEIFRSQYADGVGYIALAGVTDPALLLPAIAQGLGVREDDRRSLLERTADQLADRRCLLVLDNFEQIVAAASVLVEVLAASPHLTLLVTSRAPLRVSGERIYPVPPMVVPAPGMDAEVVDSEAVLLFVNRAVAVRPDVTLTEATTPVIAEICRRLDGLPLAIELAAARSGLFSPPVILARLKHRLPLLISGPRDQPARLQTMRGAIAWSYDLLTEAEQSLFRHLSVYTAGFSLAAAVALSDAQESDVLACLDVLIDHSLVRPMFEQTDEPRFVMLETIREFGLDQLDAAGEAVDAREQHARFFVELVERVDPDVYGPDASLELARLDLERSNLQTALAWLIDRGNAKGALRLTSALWRSGASGVTFRKGRPVSPTRSPYQAPFPPRSAPMRCGSSGFSCSIWGITRWRATTWNRAWRCLPRRKTERARRPCWVRWERCFACSGSCRPRGPIMSGRSRCSGNSMIRLNWKWRWRTWAWPPCPWVIWRRRGSSWKKRWR